MNSDAQVNLTQQTQQLSALFWFTCAARAANYAFLRICVSTYGANIARHAL